jgi:hypothetical protein
MCTINVTKILHVIPSGNYSYLFPKYNKVERNVHLTSVTLPYTWGKLRWGCKCTSRLISLDTYLHFDQILMYLWAG